MAANKRTKEQREADLPRIARLYLQGVTHEAIAQEVGVSRVQITQDLKTVRATWLQSAVRDFDSAKAEELARIDLLEAEYWAAWKASKSPRQITTTKRKTASLKDGKAPPIAQDEAGVRKEQRDGDPRFLDGVRSCIDRRCKLLGLDAPMRAQLSGPNGGPIPHHVEQGPDLSNLTDEQLAQYEGILAVMSAGAHAPDC